MNENGKVNSFAAIGKTATGETKYTKAFEEDFQDKGVCSSD